MSNEPIPSFTLETFTEKAETILTENPLIGLLVQQAAIAHINVQQFPLQITLRDLLDIDSDLEVNWTGVYNNFYTPNSSGSVVISIAKI